MNALKGIRVLDMSSAIAGPYCGQVLADLGADVIKVEHPGRAFSERTSLSPPTWAGPRFAPFWLSVNRNKRSVTLDLKRDAGKEVFADLLRVSDVVLENLGGDARPNLVDEAWAWKVNERVIWASVTFCGRTGPDAGLDGYDLLAQARGGLLSLTGAPGAPPTKAGSSVADYLAGCHLAIGVLAALRQRDVTGRGQLVDVSLLESMVACLDGFPLWHSVAGVVPPQSGNGHPTGHFGYAVYRCTDGYIATSVNAGRVAGLVQGALGRPDLWPIPESHDSQFAPHMTKVVAALAAWAADRPVADAHDALTQARVPNTPVNDMAQLWNDPQLEARGMVLEYDLDDLGTVRSIGSPVRLSDSPNEVRRVPPEAGQHNEEVLTEVLGYAPDRVLQLVEDDVLWGWS